MTYFVSKLDCYHISNGKLINHSGVCVCSVQHRYGAKRPQITIISSHRREKKTDDMFEPEVQNTVILRHRWSDYQPKTWTKEHGENEDTQPKNCPSIIPGICRVINLSCIVNWSRNPIYLAENLEEEMVGPQDRTSCRQPRLTTQRELTRATNKPRYARENRYLWEENLLRFDLTHYIFLLTSGHVWIV